MVTTSRRTVRRVFNKEHYGSGDGFLTTVWGGPMWLALHTMSFNYPVAPTAEDKRKYRNFILSLQNVLPCKYCRINLKNNFKKLPLTMEAMESRETFSRYVYRLHELVNTMLGKKSGLTYEMVRDRFEHFRARCGGAARGGAARRTRKKKIESGCTDPLHGRKLKCVLKITPREKKCETFQMCKV